DIFCLRIFSALSTESLTSTSSGRPSSVSKRLFSCGEEADLTLATGIRQATMCGRPRKSGARRKSSFADTVETGYVTSRFVPEFRSRHAGFGGPPGSASGQKGANRMLMGAKVFTATKAKDREELGEVVTRWIRDNPRARILDKIVTQSSDSEFHCLTITIF